MKKFETPAMEVSKLEIEDVITTSTTCTDDNCPNDMGGF